VVGAGDPRQLPGVDQALASDNQRERSSRSQREACGQCTSPPLGHAHYSGLLRDELGLSPSAEVRELERDLWPSAPN